MTLFQTLFNAGVPEVYCVMAERNKKFPVMARYGASRKLVQAFIWGDTLEGHEFWSAIYSELQHENK